MDVLDVDKHQRFLQVDFNTLGIKVFCKVICMIMKTWSAWWWAWSSVLKILKVISLQCLYNISNGVHYGVHQDQNFCKLDYRFFMKASMSKVLKKGSMLSFCNIWRKGIVTVFVFYCNAKHSDTLRGSSPVCFYLFLKTFQQSRFCQDSPGFWYAIPVSRIDLVCPVFYISHQKMFLYAHHFSSAV